jgi:hypothetical protein
MDMHTGAPRESWVECVYGVVLAVEDHIGWDWAKAMTRPR